MLKRTPLLALVIAVLLTICVKYLVEEPARPFTGTQTALLYFLCFLVSMGIALFFDPNARKAKEEYLKINFYAEEEDK